MSDITRRSLLRTASLLSLGSATGFALNLASMNAFAASTGGYRAVVCVFLFGGMDCHDTVLPYDQPSYDAITTIRQSMYSQYSAQAGGSSRARNRLLPLNAVNASDQGGLEFALPEQLALVHDLFVQGNAAIVGNVGPLIEPTNRDQFRSGTVRLPPRLFSHNDQQSTWMTSQPEGAQYGWGGRMGDIMLAAQANPRATFTSVSAGGNAVFLSGNTVQQIQVNTNGATSINGVDSNSLYGSQSVPVIFNDHLTDAGNTLTNLLERDFTAVTRRSIQANRDLRAALDAAPPLATVFPQNGLANQLKIVARMIGVRSALGVGRQVFFVSTGGYDTHSNQAATLPNLHSGIASAMRAFYDATVELGVSSDVTTFTASDFGRTLADNGDGTDHGWGAHHFVIGGGVRGTRLFGQMAPTGFQHSMDANNGRLIPTTSVDQYASGIARWFGLSDSEIRDAIPGSANFTPSALDLFSTVPTT